MPSSTRRARTLPVLLAAAGLSAGCASLDPPHDWWAVRTTGSGDAARLLSTSHVNHGRPPRETPVAPRLLREARRDGLSVAVHYDAALATDWADAAWTSGRELDKALDWMARLADEEGARVSITLVDDAHALHAEHALAVHPPSVQLYVPAVADPPSRSAVVGRALSKGLHELVHAVSARRNHPPGAPQARRFDEERRAALVEACYLLDTLRPGDALSLDVAGQHARTDNFATLQSRAATVAVVQDLRRIAGRSTLATGDTAARAALQARCDQVARSGR